MFMLPCINHLGGVCSRCMTHLPSSLLESHTAHPMHVIHILGELNHDTIYSSYVPVRMETPPPGGPAELTQD